MAQRALITGITGQDGAYLAALLLDKGYDVHGLVRWDAVDGAVRLRALGVEDKVTLHWGDLADPLALAQLITRIQPNEIYNLAALTDVAVSFATPAAAVGACALGALHVLEAARLHAPSARVYQASSSEMFGTAPPPQDEDTPMHPASPYGAAKLAAYWLARTYRDAYGMHASNGILFNHESPLRGEGFVTKKIARGAAAIAVGAQTCLTLGNLDAQRDWGHARDYAAGMWAMVQQDAPGDYVLATGKAHTVREAAERALARVGIDLIWEGRGVEEVGRCRASGAVRVRVDPALFRPKEVPALLGNAAKARRALCWAPQVTFAALIDEMVDAERACFT
ncbi:MAG TPA: GDP-mannose 4,6-dehydratase [Rhodospirillaceae bacterium]|nr:GDP-mannose 4,6-dehydratase [Alphaproteobacteria bacterium]HBH25806.1 GDP-mannose 4,6-dehydratase [Rhodospirillaceae bacterium]